MHEMHYCDVKVVKVLQYLFIFNLILKNKNLLGFKKLYKQNV